MQDWRPGRSLLGFLTIKVAADTSYLGPGQVRPGNAGANPIPGQQPGTGTPFGAFTSLAGVLGGDLGTAFSPMALQMLAPYFARHGIDLRKPFQAQFGGSPEEARRLQEVQQALLEPTMQAAGEQFSHALDALGDAAQHFNIPVAQELLGMYKQIGNEPDRNRIMGQVVTMLAQSDPQAAEVLQTVMPGLVTDWSPLVKMVYARNEGKFNADDFKATQAWFKDSVDKNKFYGAPAQAALEVMPYALEKGGANVNSKQISNLAFVAKEIMARNMAPTYGASMELAAELGNPLRIMDNPTGVLTSIDTMRRQAKASNMSPEQFYAAMQEARANNQSPMAVMTAMAAGAAATRALGPRGEPTAETPAYRAGAVQAFANLAQSDSMRSLAALRDSDPRWGRSIDRMIANGDVAGINRTIASARDNPAFWQNLKDVDATSIVKSLGERPGMLGGVAMGDLQWEASISGNPQLIALTNNPKEMIRRLSTRDFSGLTAQTRSVLSTAGPDGARFGGAYLAAQQDLRDNGYRGGRLAPLKPFSPMVDLPTVPGVAAPGSRPNGPAVALPPAPVTPSPYSRTSLYQESPEATPPAAAQPAPRTTPMTAAEWDARKAPAPAAAPVDTPPPAQKPAYRTTPMTAAEWDARKLPAPAGAPPVEGPTTAPAPAAVEDTPMAPLTPTHAPMTSSSGPMPTTTTPAPVTTPKPAAGVSHVGTTVEF